MPSRVVEPQRSIPPARSRVVATRRSPRLPQWTALAPRRGQRRHERHRRRTRPRRCGSRRGSYPERLDGARHGNSASHRARRTVEHDKEPVAGRRDLLSAEGVDDRPHLRVVGEQGSRPIADRRRARASRSRVDDVREEHGGQDPLAGTLGTHANDTGARPLDGFECLVPNDPCIVARWDLVDGAATDLDFFAAFRDHGEPAGDRVTEMMVLAPLGAGDWPKVRRPPPARLPDGVADGHLAEIHHAEQRARDGPRLVRCLECLGLESSHPSRLHRGLLAWTPGRRQTREPARSAQANTVLAATYRLTCSVGAWGNAAFRAGLGLRVGGLP